MKCGLHRRIEFARQRQANLFLGSRQHNRMNTIMKNRHTAKRSQTHDTIDPWRSQRITSRERFFGELVVLVGLVLGCHPKSNPVVEQNVFRVKGLKLRVL